MKKIIRLGFDDVHVAVREYVERHKLLGRSVNPKTIVSQYQPDEEEACFDVWAATAAELKEIDEDRKKEAGNGPQG